MKNAQKFYRFVFKIPYVDRVKILRTERDPKEIFADILSVSDEESNRWYKKFENRRRGGFAWIIPKKEWFFVEIWMKIIACCWKTPRKKLGNLAIANVAKINLIKAEKNIFSSIGRGNYLEYLISPNNTALLACGYLGISGNYPEYHFPNCGAGFSINPL